MKKEYTVAAGAVWGTQANASFDRNSSLSKLSLFLSKQMKQMKNTKEIFYSSTQRA